jgi:hypothetical protein
MNTAMSILKLRDRTVYTVYNHLGYVVVSTANHRLAEHIQRALSEDHSRIWLLVQESHSIRDRKR